jgi:tetratricopeptide (TPR) repeat protein
MDGRPSSQVKLALLVPSALLVVVSGLMPQRAGAQGHDGHAGAPAAAATSPKLLGGLSDHTHPIATTNPEAQKYFDMGLNLSFAFNKEESERAFRKAAELDPKAPMPQWGIAYALGPDINTPRVPERDKGAYEAITKARSLAASGAEPERDYIEAMAARYSNDPKADLRALDEAYRNAMKQVTQKYPDDLDAATIYAESIMDLNPWKFWGPDGKPAVDTPEILAVLESVLRRDPGQIGANHLYIHAVEASPDPYRALASAQRLETAAPAAGHLVHMPGHIYLRTGDFSRTVAMNEKAVLADDAFFKDFGKSAMYPIMYATHNSHFVWYGSMQSGMKEKAIAAADRVHSEMVASTPPGDLDPVMGPFFEMYGETPIAARWRFGMWDEILKLPPPDKRFVIDTAMWHAARGVALAAKKSLTQAREEKKLFSDLRDTIPPTWAHAFSPAQDYLAVAGHVMNARILESVGDHDGAIAAWNAAVQAQDNLPYNEPPEWFYPVRESHGGALLRSGRAAEAEKVFRADLDKNPRNARSLFGLWKCLEAQKKTADAALVKRQFDAAWKDATVTLDVKDL